MDHKKCTFAVMQGLVSEPVDQISVILCGEDVVNGVFGPEGHNAFSGSQQKELMITQDKTDGRVKILDETQRGERVRTPVDQITDEPERVDGWIEGNAIQESPERIETALNIPDCVGGHQ